MRTFGAPAVHASTVLPASRPDQSAAGNRQAASAASSTGSNVVMYVLCNLSPTRPWAPSFIAPVASSRFLPSVTPLIAGSTPSIAVPVMSTQESRAAHPHCERSGRSETPEPLLCILAHGCRRSARKVTEFKVFDEEEVGSGEAAPLRGGMEAGLAGTGPPLVPETERMKENAQQPSKWNEGPLMVHRPVAGTSYHRRRSISLCPM